MYYIVFSIYIYLLNTLIFLVEPGSWIRSIQHRLDFIVEWFENKSYSNNEKNFFAYNLDCRPHCSNVY